MDRDNLLKLAKRYATPTYVFDTDEFKRRVAAVRDILGKNISLCYSVKANPFLLACLPPEIEWVEVCSPGELTICEKLHLNTQRIIYSGVNKGASDIGRAVADGVAVITAESLLQAALINQAASARGKKVAVILRLSSGNQFGMSKSDAAWLLDNKESYSALDLVGLHYYSGTQKKKAAEVQKDISHFAAAIAELVTEHDFCPQRIEYGPGLAVEYFNAPYDVKDLALLQNVSDALRSLAGKYPVTVEMGRFLAATCGTYLTAVADTKVIADNNFAICDGGINHLKYFGQTMAMQVPPVTAAAVKAQQEIAADTAAAEKELLQDWTLCGSLCTTADVLVRKVQLPALTTGDILAFQRCGAYAVTEGLSLFLSRSLPRVVLYSAAAEAVLVRDFYNTDELNTPVFTEE